MTGEEELAKLKKGVEENYGAMPTCCTRLFDLGLIRNLAGNIGVKAIDITQKTAHMVFVDGECFKDKDVMLAVQDMQNEVNLTYEECPKLQFECKFRPIDEKLDKFKKFLLKCGKSF